MLCGDGESKKCVRLERSKLDVVRIHSGSVGLVDSFD
jgi:hypothetical protein